MDSSSLRSDRLRRLNRGTHGYGKGRLESKRPGETKLLPGPMRLLSYTSLRFRTLKTHTSTIVFSYLDSHVEKDGEEPQGGQVSWKSMVEQIFQRCKSAIGGWLQLTSG